MYLIWDCIVKMECSDKIMQSPIRLETFVLVANKTDMIQLKVIPVSLLNPITTSNRKISTIVHIKGKPYFFCKKLIRIMAINNNEIE